MSRRAAIVEEEFDDDTDIPLPSRPLANTGPRGAILEQIGDSDEDESDDDAPQLVAPSTSNPQSPAHPQFRGAQSPPSRPENSVTDITPYKKWTCIYPLYIDAKRAYGTGQRRVAREKAVWWPLSKDIADATNRLGLGTLHEVNKAHPRDWDNPGRVRVQWKKDGRLVNPAIKTKKQLLEAITFQIHHLKPENIPKKPFNFTPPETASATAAAQPATKVIAKGKQPASASKPAPSAAVAPPTKRTSKRRLPVPPEPLPPLQNRLSPYSPALPTGMLVDAVKAGMSAQQESPVPGLPGGAGAQKGKRKVVRVRG